MVEQVGESSQKIDEDHLTFAVLRILHVARHYNKVERPLQCSSHLAVDTEGPTAAAVSKSEAAATSKS